MSRVKISVIIPVYNERDTVSETIARVRASPAFYVILSEGAARSEESRRSLYRKCERPG